MSADRVATGGDDAATRTWPGGEEPQVFVQVLEPLGRVWTAAAVALLPLGVLLVCLAGLRISAWAAVLLCAALTIALAVVVWDAPLDGTLRAYGLGSATGLWAVGWIVFWGLVISNTMVTMVAFAALRDWLARTSGCRCSCWPGRSGRCWKGWSGSATRGPWSPRS